MSSRLLRRIGSWSACLTLVGLVTCCSSAEDEQAASQCEWWRVCGVDCGTCDDGDPCTEDRCLGGMCGHIPIDDGCGCTESGAELQPIVSVAQTDGGLEGLDNPVAIAADRDGNHVYVLSRADGVLTVLGHVEGALEWRGSVDVGSGRDLSLSPAGDRVVVVTDDGLSEWAVRSDGPPEAIGGVSGQYTTVVATAEGYVALGEGGGRVVDSAGARDVPGTFRGVRRAVLSPDGSVVLAAVFDDARVVAIDAASGSELPASGVSNGFTSPTDVLFSEDGTRVYVADLCGHSVHVFARGASGELERLSILADDSGETECAGIGALDDFDPSEQTVRNPVALARLGNGDIVVGFASLRFELERYRDVNGTLESVDDFFNGRVALGVVHIDGLLGGGYRGFSPTLDDAKVRDIGALAVAADRIFATSGMASAVGAFDGVRATGFLQQGQGGVMDLPGAYTLRVSADSKHVYVAPRNHDTVGVFSTTSRGGVRSLTAPLLPVLEPEDPVEPGDLEGEDGAVAHVALYGPNERFLAAAESRRQELHILDRDPESGTLSWKEGTPLPTCAGQPAFPADVLATPDSGLLLVADFQVEGTACVHSWPVEEDGGVGSATTLEDPILDGIETFAITANSEHVYAACFASAAVVHLRYDPSVRSVVIADFAKQGPKYQGIEIMALSPDEAHLYVTSPTTNSVFAFERDGTGALTEIQTVAEGDAPQAGAAGIVVTRDGSQVFVASRQQDGITVFDRDRSTGRLVYRTLVEHPSLVWPNGLALNGDGSVLYAASTGSNALTAFRVTAEGPACP